MNRDEYDFTKAKQGAISDPLAGKTRITIRIDTDILNWFRSQVHKKGGGNYQTLLNEALREFILAWLKERIIFASRFVLCISLQRRSIPR